MGIELISSCISIFVTLSLFHICPYFWGTALKTTNASLRFPGSLSLPCWDGWSLPRFSASYLTLSAWLISLTPCNLWTDKCFEEKSISDCQNHFTVLLSLLVLLSWLPWWSWTSICAQSSAWPLHCFLLGFSVSQPKLIMSWQIPWGEGKISGSPQPEFPLHSETLSPQVLASTVTLLIPSAVFNV